MSIFPKVISKCCYFLTFNFVFHLQSGQPTGELQPFISPFPLSNPIPQSQPQLCNRSLSEGSPSFLPTSPIPASKHKQVFLGNPQITPEREVGRLPPDTHLSHIQSPCLIPLSLVEHMLHPRLSHCPHLQSITRLPSKSPQLILVSQSLNQQAMEVEEIGRLIADLCLSLLSSKFNLPVSSLDLQQNRCFRLASLPALNFRRSHSSATPPYPTNYIPVTSILWEPFSHALQRSKYVNKATRQVSDLYFPSSAKQPIVQFHPQLCIRLSVVPLLTLCFQSQEM